MATKGRDHREPGPDVAGSLAAFTLLEVTIVLVLVSVLTVTITMSMRSLTRDHAYVRGQHRVREVADRVIRGMERDLGFAARLFDESAEGRAYLAAMDLPAAWILAGSRLPVVTERGYFEKDPPGGIETGNVLLAGTTLGFRGLDISPAKDGSDVVRVEVLHFVAYYVRVHPDGSLDLSRWVSRPLARYDHVTAVEDNVRQHLLRQALAAQGVEFAWDVDAKREKAFFRLVSPVTSLMEPFTSPNKIPGDDGESKPAILRARRMSVLRNGEGGRLRVPQFATATRGSDFPGGFEVKIDRTTAGKFVLVQLAVGRANGGGEIANHTRVRRLVLCRGG